MNAAYLDPRAALLAKHAQHVVLIHFPIALFVTAVAADFLATWRRDQRLAMFAKYNIVIAAVMSIPAVLTGLLAWRFQFAGQPLKGLLLIHLVAGVISAVVICLCARMYFGGGRNLGRHAGRLALETLGMMVIGFTAHLGGFLAGVNG